MVVASGVGLGDRVEAWGLAWTLSLGWVSFFFDWVGMVWAGLSWVWAGFGEGWWRRGWVGKGRA